MDSKSNTATVPTADSIHTKLPLQEQNNSGVHRLWGRSDLFHVIAFAFLTYNAVLSIYRSRGNPWDLAFVISCFAELILLFWCLKKFENHGADVPLERKHQLKVVVWVLTTLLTVTFAWKVSLIMPLCLTLVIWGMSASVIIAGFYAFFIFNNDVKGGTDYCKLGDKQNKLCEQLNPEEVV
ncbi:hypothetical protein LUZ61_005101 [Rhynchospora tenuis]|uniref:Uncharacterized protein n=1 Tax=Rhynchospora tenuis TaxID=198213 RepID=A0AAD6EU93_9POAL|nr:hypothetical protein LUZ61_005101 [Rhynchospora tenuis]